jgi:ribosome-associated toxin RatA of RatAB toxin-antitoxin module
VTAERRLKEKAPEGLPDPFTELTFRGQTHTAGIYLICFCIPPFAQSVNHYLSHHKYFRCTGASRFRSRPSPPGVIFLIIGILLLVASGVTAADENPNPWKVVNNAEGVTVWSRKVPASPLQEVKAETVVEAPPERVWQLLTDVERFPEFMPYLKEVRILGPAESRGRYEYHLIDPPIVNRRDYTLRTFNEVDETKGIYRRCWVLAKGKGPDPAQGVVRIRTCRGQWTVTRLGASKTRVEYYLHTDPGGFIPVWLANKANTVTLPDLMKAVRQRSLDPNSKPK